LQVRQNGAQRASGHRTRRFFALMALASIIGLTGLLTGLAPAQAATPMKVAIIVGPSHSATARYISHARRYAAQARHYGATVVEIYSPNATWTRVRTAAAGANILIYLGHGNGSPSPYGPFSAARRNGMGLNAAAGRGHANVKYYGQDPVRTGIKLDRNAVVLLNHLCYASGNSEPGHGNPSKSVAMQRADGYGTGFLRTGAKIVFAVGRGGLETILTRLFTSNMNMAQIFTTDPSFSGTRDFRFASRKTPGAAVWMAPYARARYYYSMNGSWNMTAAQVRAG
jgi:hypothetical protein